MRTNYLRHLANIVHIVITSRSRVGVGVGLFEGGGGGNSQLN